MALKAVIIATLLAAVVKPAPRPPARFVAMLGKLDGFRLDSRDQGWTPQAACRGYDRQRTACALIEQSWRVRTVKLGTSGRHVVVQELWLWRYDTGAEAERATRSLARDFNAGPFAKHPFKVHRCREYLVITVSRHRFPTPHAELHRAVGKALGKQCAL